MLWAVAGRFHFGSDEIFAMPLHRLEFWYRGHVAMHLEEKGALDAAKETLTRGRS